MKQSRSKVLYSVAQRDAILSRGLYDDIMGEGHCTRVLVFGQVSIKAQVTLPCAPIGVDLVPQSFQTGVYTPGVPLERACPRVESDVVMDINPNRPNNCDRDNSIRILCEHVYLIKVQYLEKIQLFAYLVYK